MDADWYVDPLDRFDGRFFDGERWTERVSDGGQLTIDPEFAPLTEGPGPQPGESDPRLISGGGSVPGGDVLVRRSIRPGLPAANITESPVRAVAVLDGTGLGGTRPGDNGFLSSQPAQRRIIVWGLLVSIAVLAVVGYNLLGNDDEPSQIVADPLDLAEEQVARIDDLEAGGVGRGADQQPVEDLDVAAPDDAVPAGATFGADELIEVGALQILNGTSVLQDLESWHRDFAAERGIDLGPGAGCWFGQLGGVALQSVHCGPVGETRGSEFLYDLVPLVFEASVGGQIAQPVVDAAMIDMVLANALSLVGPRATPD